MALFKATALAQCQRRKDLPDTQTARPNGASVGGRMSCLFSSSFLHTGEEKRCHQLVHMEEIVSEAAEEKNVQNAKPLLCPFSPKPAPLKPNPQML